MNRRRREQGIGLLGGGVLGIALVRLALVLAPASCKPAVSPEGGEGGVPSSVAQACTNLVTRLGCGHDYNACLAGLGNDVDGGRQSVDLNCAASADTLDAAIHCVGIGACP
jgi:hypothetical protein